ncbi:Serine/threonine protein kinase [Handroanthus impetiginosus]|uniref:RING-type E3 ubiquitin transferase n=1 Tax=Handroanthus impetiginosus TaxID=429701 RepID=A0A2G9I3P4_9LAMI|nr:Serine/threonine protein kinase [Handroanthus impetiginosus]
MRVFSQEAGKNNRRKALSDHLPEYPSSPAIMATLQTHPRRPAEEFLSGFSPAATFQHGFGGSVPPESAAGGGVTVHVAVGKSVEKAVALLQWTFSTFPGQDICLLHVHRPSPLIPTLLGKLPASRANPETVATFRNQETEETRKLLHTYLMTCSRSRVKASVITTERDEVQKGIVDLVNLHNVKKLVVGAIPDFLKGRKSSSKTCHVAKYAPSYCEMWFVDKGKLIWTRQAFATTPTHNLRSCSLNSGESEVIVRHKDKDSCSSSGRDENWVPAEASQAEITSSSVSQCDPLYSDSVSSSTYATPAEPSLSSVSSAKTMEECLSVQLAELRREVDESKDEAYIKLLEQKQAEAEAMEAFNMVKALETALSREVKLRGEAEDALRTTLQCQENLLQEREKSNQQLQKTMRNIAVLDSRAQEANRRREEVAGELKLIQASIAALRKEKQKLQRQKIEATRWLDRWRSREQCEDAGESKFMGLMADISQLPEFLLSDLEAATCNFSENFRIGQGGCGVVYKGELLDKTVAIKKLHSYNMQRQREFDNAVQVLNKLHHPRLVKLIGVCPDSWLLVYEYLPGGSIQNLFNNNSISALNWKIRSRIVADIASGLLFLHSSMPKKIVHGNLKPENLLLDSENRCRISDYGDHMLMSSQNFRCPSFRRCSSSTGVSLHIDPDSHRTGTLTHKSDIYSLGVIILELVTGKTHGGLIGQVRRALSNGKVTSILDSSAGEWPTYVARRLVELGLQCCESNSRARPELTPSLVKELEHMPFLEEQTIPSFFLCPILREIMHDPHVAADGFTYEGEALLGWLGNGRETSPMTNLRLSHLNLTPNHSLRLAIQDWLANLEIAECS